MIRNGNLSYPEPFNAAHIDNMEKRRNGRHVIDGFFAKTIFNTDVEIIDISKIGASIRLARRLNIGSRYSFVFGEGAKALRITGLVIWAKLSAFRRENENEVAPIYTFGIEFKDIPAGETSQLEKLIMIKTREIREKKLGAIKVRLSAKDKVILSYAESCAVKDISIGGIRIESRQDLPKETLLQIEVNFVENDPPLRATGRVAFCRYIEGSMLFYAGVEFIQMNAEHQERLLLFVESLP